MVGVATHPSRLRAVAAVPSPPTARSTGLQCGEWCWGRSQRLAVLSGGVGGWRWSGWSRGHDRRKSGPRLVAFFVAVGGRLQEGGAVRIEEPLGGDWGGERRLGERRLGEGRGE